jgi:hypothetical protein
MGKGRNMHRGKIALTSMLVPSGCCLGVAGCYGSQDPTESPAGTNDVVDEAAVREIVLQEGMELSERIGEASEAMGSAAGEACRAACASAYALLCTRVAIICGSAAVVTIGSATVPCATALMVACGGGAGLASLCAGRCPR